MLLTPSIVVKDSLRAETNHCVMQNMAWRYILLTQHSSTCAFNVSTARKHTQTFQLESVVVPKRTESSDFSYPWLLWNYGSNK